MGIIEGKLRKDGTPAKKCGRPRIHPIPPPKDPNRPKHGKGVPKTGKGAKGLLRPQLWKTGTDPILHDMYFEWNLSKAQYNYRYKHKLDPGRWLVDFDHWAEIWQGKWDNRGRKGHNYCISRINPEGDWIKGNIEVIERRDHTRRQAEAKKRRNQRLNEKQRKQK